MVVSTFSILNKDERERFFKRSFLLANIQPDVVLRMFFLTINNVDIDFQAWDLQQKSYTTRNIFLTTRQFELIGKKVFAIAALNLEHKTFVVYRAVLCIDFDNNVYISKKAQMAYLKVNKALIKVLSKYTDFIDILLPKQAAKLPKHIKINNHTIKFVDH